MNQIAIGLTDGVNQMAVYVTADSMEALKNELLAHFGDRAYEVDMSTYATALATA